MPLLDHFHEPINPRADWESFHHRWANAIADSLDRSMPPQFFARVEVHLGADVASDVAEYEPDSDIGVNGSTGGVAVQTYAPPAPTIVIPGNFLNETEIHVRTAVGERLLGVIELISESNKGRPANRAAFAAKIAAYLLSGVGVVVVDVVTCLHFNLHNEFVALLGLGPEYRMADDPSLYASAYRPISRIHDHQIDAWLYPLEIDHPLPTVPFYLRAFGCIPLDLEASYTETRERSRLLRS
jgi:Protein of unknown function (DUF4058)